MLEKIDEIIKSLNLNTRKGSIDIINKYLGEWKNNLDFLAKSLDDLKKELNDKEEANKSIIRENEILKKEKKDLLEEIDKLKDSNRTLKNRLELKLKEIPNDSKTNTNTDNNYIRQNGIFNQKPKVLFVENENLKKEDNFLFKKDTSSSIIDTFNRWASNPNSNLPQTFYYLKGDVKIRTNMQLVASNIPTKWIVNSVGETRYLFPNPNTFDDRTDISQIYNMDLNALKLKGQNRIKIIKACEMTDKGFVEFKGELQLL